MCQTKSFTLDSKASKSILIYQLGMDKAEVILIVLNALYECKKNPNQSFEQLLVNGQKMFCIETLPSLLDDVIGRLCDEIYMPVYRQQFPLTPIDYLMQVDFDVDTITDIETQNIINDIETQHGKINWEAL